jgi:2-oxo-3-hexenedioate decarboxylase/2-keto-4-pentenoate hydratase
MAVTQSENKYDDSQVQQAAAILCENRRQRTRFDHFPSRYVPPTEADAYRVQHALHGCLISGEWGRTVGHKIGCTTPVMQAYLGIPNPCGGGVFDTTVHHRHGKVSYPAALRVGVECEIAIRLGADLPADGAPFDHASVAVAVGSCMAAIEIVEDRYVDYPSLDTPTLIADDFFGAGCVLGEEARGFDPFALPEVTAEMWINGQQVGSGVGTDILDHPLDALTWLANSMAERGFGLHRGEFVLLGSLVQTNWVEPGDEVVVVNEPLGEVRATFA